MSGEMGIKLEKQVSLLQKNIKVQPKSLFISLVKATINGAFLKWDDFAESGVEILESLGLEAKSGEIAGLLIVRSLMQAMQNLLEENKELLNRKPDNLKILYDNLNESLGSSELTIDEDFFQRPQDLSIVKEAKTGFARWLEDFVDKPIEIQQISGRLPAYFVFALNNQWVTNFQDYSVLKDELDTPFTKASKREQGWLYYRAWLQKQVEEPMFLEAFSLKQIYVPLRGYYEQEKEDKEDKDNLLSNNPKLGIENQKSVERIVVNLEEELETWLQEAKPDDAIRLITGGPGSGKSSFAKILASQQAEKGDIPVLFIPLHRFKVFDDLIRAVGEFVEFDGFLSDNPLERGNDTLRLLIIFDGLDELSMQGKIGEEVAKQFIDEVKLKVGQFNARRTRLQVLISGREVVVQANRSKFRKPNQLLYLLPYFVTEEEKKSREKNYVDEQHLLEEDQRQLWWQFYGKVKGKDYKRLPLELDKPNLVEITVQPLLNYLIALSFERDKLQFKQGTNLNEIYADLLEAVYERGYERYEYRPTEGIKKNEFIGILEEIALSCWHGDGRTTTVSEIENHCENSGLGQILHRFQESFQEESRASVTRLLTAFYFRESGGIRTSEKTFEFTHKSFGEYLTAKRIVEGVQLIHEDLEERKKSFRKGCDERDALVRWATLCGSSTMDEYLFLFIFDEMRLQGLEKVRNWQKTLCRLIEFMMVNGMPMEGLKERPSFQEEMRRARNAEQALLIVLNACARVTEIISEIAWDSLGTFGAWISRLQGQRTEGENVFVIRCLSLLNLRGCILFFRDFYSANLERANLQEANLRGANLQKANLRGVDLRGANLQGVDLERANLEGVNLEGVNIKRK